MAGVIAGTLIDLLMGVIGVTPSFQTAILYAELRLN
jgi:hypothetical protein